jgi:hypothetical protein
LIDYCSNFKDAAASTPGGLWRMNFEEGITHFLEKRVKLTDVFRNVGAITAGQVGSTSIMVDGDLEKFDPLNDICNMFRYFSNYACLLNSI